MPTLFEAYGIPDIGAMPKPLPSDDSDFGRGLKESFQQLPQLGYGLMAGAGAAAESAFGDGGIATGIKKAGVEGYQRWGDKIASQGKESDSWSYSYDQAKEGNFGALVDWLQHGLGYVGGQGVQMLATAGIGAVGGKFVAGTAAKQIAEGMVAKEASRIGAESAGKLAADEVTRLATAKVAQKFANIGMNTAVAGMGLGQEGGEIFGDLTQEAGNRVLTGAELGKAFAATLAAGGLEFVGDKVGLDILLGKSKLLRPAESMTGFGGRAARGAIAGTAAAPIEGATEYGQTLIEEWGKGKDPMAPESLHHAKDAAALGMLGGAAIGGVGGAIRGPKPRVDPVADILGAQDLDGAIRSATDGVFGGGGSQGLALADPVPPAASGLDFEADPRFAGAPIFDNGAAPAQPVFGSKQAADIHIGESGELGKLQAVEVRPGQWQAQQTPAAANDAAQRNIERWAERAEPMTREEADGAVAAAMSRRNLALTAIPLPDGRGWTAVPTAWVRAPGLGDYIEQGTAAAAVEADRNASIRAEALAPARQPAGMLPEMPGGRTWERDMAGITLDAEAAQAQQQKAADLERLPADAAAQNLQQQALQRAAALEGESPMAAALRKAGAAGNAPVAPATELPAANSASAPAQAATQPRIVPRNPDMEPMSLPRAQETAAKVPGSEVVAIRNRSGKLAYTVLPPEQAAIRPGDILTQDQYPYGTKTAATIRARKEGPGWAAVEVPGGFAVRRQDGPAPMAEATPSAPTAAQVAPVAARPGTTLNAAKPAPQPQPGSTPTEATGEAAPIEGQKIDREWTAFAPDSGTLSIPRAEMPQIRAEHRGAMVNFLNARGIEHEATEVPAGELKPTQAEFSPAKVKKAREFTGGDRSILVSSDGHVLDGHHQWLAKRESGEPIKVIRLKAPIKRLLAEVREFPSAETSTGGAKSAASSPQATHPALERGPAESRQTASNPEVGVEPTAQAGATPTLRERLAKRRTSLAEEVARKAADPNRKRRRTLEELVRCLADGNLTGCLRKAGDAIHADDRKALLERAAVLRREGRGATEAGRQAAHEQLAAVDALIAELRARPAADDQPLASSDARAGADTGQKGADRIDDVGEKVGGARKDLAMPTGPRGVAPKSDAKPSWAKRFDVREIAASDKPDEVGRWHLVDTKRSDWTGQPRSLGVYESREAAERAMVVAAVSDKHRVGTTRVDGADRFTIMRAVTDRKRVQVVEQTFETREEALRYMAEHAREILDTDTSFGEEILPRPDKVQRVLPIGAMGRTSDVGADDFRETFGFRGVEFGNWNAQDERQTVMNHAYDALTDLATVLNVPPRALSLNGDLALAFGARGHGLSGARAHYERDYGVINLTKMKGAGSLAHEWLHSLDHYLGRQDGKASSEKVTNTRGDKVFDAKSREDDYASHGFKREGSGVRLELREAYRALIQTMFSKAQRYVEDTQRADRFVAEARTDVANKLQAMRAGLAKQLDPRYYKRLNAPASAEQLAQFDAIAQPIIDGQVLDTEWRKAGKSDRIASYRWTSDGLEALSAIYKAVRGRSGFDSTNKSGVLDDLRSAMGRYSQRLKMLAEAQASTEKTKAVPTDFAMEARSIDQGRASDYWATPHEMAARAFQAYVEDRIADKGGRSDFLTYGTNTVIPTPWGWKRPFPAGEERKAINEAFDRFVGELKTREDAAGNVAMFSRTEAGPEMRALQALAKNDDLFAYPRSQADTLAGLAADIDPQITIGEPRTDANGAQRYDVTMPDGSKGIVYVRKPNPYGQSLYGFDLAEGEMTSVYLERPGENADEVPPETEDVWIDVSKFKPGTGGSKLYAIAANFAHNTDRVFIGDPAGLTDEALRRRAENMLSTALKFGTTRHIAPHPRQLVGAPKLGVPALRWVYGDDAGNIRRLVDLNLAALENALPSARQLSFDVRSGKFTNDATGVSGGSPTEELLHGLTDSRGSGGSAGLALAGRRTLARGAVLRALVRETGREGAAGRGRDGLLARIAGLGDDAREAARGIFYSRESGPSTFGLTEAEAAAILALPQATIDRLLGRRPGVERIRQMVAGMPGGIDVGVVQSVDDLPPDQRNKLTAIDSTGNVRGVYFPSSDKIWLIADNLHSEAEAKFVLLHEAFHRGLAKTIGPDAKRLLLTMHATNAKLRELTKQQMEAHGIERDEAIEEALADLAGKGEARNLKGWGKLVEMIRGWLAKVGEAIGLDITWTDDMIADFVAGIRRAGMAEDVTVNRAADDPVDGAPYTEDTRFSRTAQDLVTTDGGVFDFNRLGATRQDRIRTVIDGSRPFWLGSLTRDQLADIYGKDIPPVREYDQLTRAMENQRSKIAQDADSLYSEWAKLGSEVNDKLARVMLDATVNSVHPDGEFSPIKSNDAETEDRRKAVHARLQREFKGLPTEAQAMYRKVRDFHTGILQQLREALERRIQRQIVNGQAQAAALGSIRQAFDQYSEQGPYFPLSRFGDYLVVAKRPDGERVVASYETAGEQASAARSLRADGFTVKTKSAREYSRALDGSAGKFIGDVLTTLQALDFQDAQINGKAADLKTKLLDDINQVFIRSLPDLSHRKHFAHRKNTPGFSSDVMRGFASSAFHAASHIARLNHADQMSFALEDAYRTIDRAEGGDLNRESQVLNELALRHDAALNPNTHPLAALLNQLGFVMYLGASPAAGLIQLLQNPMVTLPYLGARYGFADTGTQMAQASKDILGAKFNRESGWDAADSPKLTDPERAMIRKLQDEGIIDLTQAHDLASATSIDRGNVARSKAAFAMSRAMKIVGWTFHVPEVMNRQVAALTAYRLEVAKSGDAGKATDAAREAITRSHFDYSASNRARYMQGNVARVVLQFKTFAQQMTYFIGRAAHQALKGEDAEVRRIARRQLVATFATTFAMAGTLGLPGLGLAGGLLGIVVGALDDDDKPWDWKNEFRNVAADAVGKEAAEVLAHGIPRALMPWDIANRVGLGDLWLRSNDREGQSPREAFATDMTNLLGPTAGTLLGWYTAADHMARGNYVKATEAIVPKFIRDTIQAARIGTEGVTSYAGEHLMDVTPAETIGRLLGFTPARVSEMYEGRNAIKNAEAAIMEKRKMLIPRAAHARMAGDTEGAAEAMEDIQAFNQRNPQDSITGMAVTASVIARRRQERQTQDGTYLPKGRDHLREAGRFAVVE